MSSPDNNNGESGDAGETNISLDDEVSLDEKTKDSIVSHEGSFSSKISDNPMELHEGVLDFEVDASEIQKSQETNGESETTFDNKDDVAEPCSRAVETVDNSNDGGNEKNDHGGGRDGDGDEDNKSNSSSSNNNNNNNHNSSKDDDSGDDGVDDGVGGGSEDGEEKESPKEAEPAPQEIKKKKKRNDSDLEDGEVTDSDEDETVKVAAAAGADDEPGGKNRDEKPPICRFFSRGQCTWGNQCRFVHPGGMGRGPSPFSHQARGYGGGGGGGPAAPFLSPGMPYASVPMAPVENAWERGLRNAKQLLKEANRRREEDPAFEDRRLHQGLQESPPRDISLRPSPSPSPPLRSKLYGTFDKTRDARSPSPLNVDRWKEERHAAATRSRQGPGDSWRDPWMRSKSPARGRPKRRSRSSSSRSYSSSISSASSYSSSRSSSHSRSRSRDRRRNRGAPASRGYRGAPRQRYPSERGRLMASPSPTRYRSRAPAAAAGVAAPPPPVTVGRPRRRSSSSSSSSRSRSRSPRRRRFSRSRTPEGIPRRPRQPSVGRTVAPPIKMNLLDKSKKLPTKRPFSASPSRSPSRSPKKLRASPSPPPPRSAAPVEVKKKTEKKSDAAKREELMKQLKAVEDAIAKKKARA